MINSMEFKTLNGRNAIIEGVGVIENITNICTADKTTAQTSEESYVFARDLETGKIFRLPDEALEPKFLYNLERFVAARVETNYDWETKEYSEPNYTVYLEDLTV